MARVDLHVHSKYSAHPSEWFLQKLGTRESYSEPEYVFEQATASGMSFITLTDHNTIDGVLRLKELHPQQVFTGVEATTYFPEDKCKAHILIYGLNEYQFAEIEKVRSDIYHLRDYIRDQNLAHSVAHATFSINGKLSLSHLEKLVLLFDVFEGINGSRDKKSNSILTHFLECLTPDILEDIYNKYRIEPISPNPWAKGYTGGSDDHAGFFIGRTYTISDAETPDEFVETIKKKQTFAAGRTSDYQSLVFSVYKITYDFSRTKSKKENSIISLLTESLLGKSSFSFSSQVFQKVAIRKSKGSPVGEIIAQLIQTLNKINDSPIENRLQLVYEKLGEISDHFFKSTFNNLKDNITEGDFIELVKNISGALPGIFLSVPFFSALGHMHQNRKVLEDLQIKYRVANSTQKKILWFTDTINDLNGVSETVKKMGWLAFERHLQVKLVYCNNSSSEDGSLPPNVLRLPAISSFTPSFYNTYTMNIPSVLQSLELIANESPDEIVISTPGITGLLGLLSARLLNVKSTGIYHTDFTSQANEVIGDEMVSNVVETYMHWFYKSCDLIRVPTMEYMGILSDRGYDIRKMALFRRGIESDIFCPIYDKTVLKQFGINDGRTLLYTGRISKDKNIDFLINVYRHTLSTHPDTNLLIIGDGPYAEEVKKKNADLTRLFFGGRLDRFKLPAIYAAADLFLFPSGTDTFGMSVLEAQACSLPAIVSSRGGPKEIIINESTGFSISTERLDLWVRKTRDILDSINLCPDKYLELRFRTREHTIKAYDWNVVLDDLVGQDASSIDQTSYPQIPHYRSKI